MVLTMVMMVNIRRFVDVLFNIAKHPAKQSKKFWRIFDISRQALTADVFV